MCLVNCKYIFKNLGLEEFFVMHVRSELNIFYDLKFCNYFMDTLGFSDTYLFTVGSET